MPEIKKLVVGIRPATKMFRIASVAGSVVDALLSARGGVISETYYTKVNIDKDNQVYRLMGDDSEHALHIDRDNIHITRDVYNTGVAINFEKTLTEFRAIWKIVNTILDVRDIRRIGLVAEHQVELGDNYKASEQLLSLITKISPQGHPAKFQLRFEDRQPLASGGIPDHEKSDFTNAIVEIYDSEADTEHPKTGAINYNIDAQRYYAPVFNGNVVDEILKIHNKTLAPSIKHWHSVLQKLGVINGR